MTDSRLERLDTLLSVGLRLARQAPSGRILLARIHATIDPEWIPRPWGDEIAAELESAARRAAEPIGPKQVEKVLESAWEDKPAMVLEDLDLSHPAKTTPAAQVHRGVLDGRPVAVKVLRPGLAVSVRQDLAVLEGLLSPLGAAFPALDPPGMIREFKERITDELDLEHEAGTQRRFHRALRNHPYLTVPAPHTGLSHEHVLVSDWIDGVPLWQAPDPDQAAARLVVFVLGAARFGVLHADPDPDDVLITDDGKLAVLDFGATRQVEIGRLDHATRALEALADGDEATFADALAQLGALPSEIAATAFDLAGHVLGELGGAAPTRLDSRAVIAARDRLFERPEQIAEVITAGSLAPEDLWPTRAGAQLFAAIARVGATGRWRDLALDALRSGWDARPEYG